MTGTNYIGTGYPTRRRLLLMATVIIVAAASLIVVPRMRAQAAGLKPNVSISDATIAEGNAAIGGVLKFTITASGLNLSGAQVNYSTHDGTATSPSDYAAKSGLVTLTSGAPTAVVSIQVVGDTTPEPNEAITVTLGSTQADVVDGSGTGTITNDDFAFTVDNATVAEGDSGTTPAQMKIHLSSKLATATSVHYETVPGTAVPSTASPAFVGDYTSVSGTANFPANTDLVTIPVSVVGDLIYEDDEAFTFVLSAPTGGVTLGDAEGLVTITDNDSPPDEADKPAVSVLASSFKEGGAAGATSTGNVTIALDKPSAKTITVKAATADGTAKTGQDYTGKTDQLITFPPGSTSQTLPITILGDNLFEGDEYFVVNLSNVSAGAKFGTNGVHEAITDDDSRPTLTVSNASGDEGTALSFTVTLSAAAGVDITLAHGTNNGTAVAPGDFTAIPAATTTVIPAGQTTKTITVETKADALSEGDEGFTLGVAQVIDEEGHFDTPKIATGLIKDKTALPLLTVADIEDDEGDTGNTAFTFTITMASASAQTVTVNLNTVGETASGASDFTGITGQLVFLPGQTTRTQVVNVKGDTDAEDDETFKLVLSAPTNAGLGAHSSGVATITNDDGEPVHPYFITTGAGSGGGPHVREFDSTGAEHASIGFAPYPAGPGVRVARGDLDGDGHDEMIVSGGPGGSSVVTVINEANAGIIAQVSAYPGFTGGVFVAAGDVDGDGVDELITTPDAGGGPHVKVFKLVGTVGNRSLSGTDGFYGTAQGFSGGLTVASADTDNDGKDEIIVGNGKGGEATVTVWKYNYATNAATKAAEFVAYPGFAGGVHVAAGDLDGDGRAEIVTGAGPGGGPHVRVFSGQGGGLPGSTFAYPAGFSGGVWVAVGDVDGDGDNEVITGAGAGGGPHVKAFDIDLVPLNLSFFAYDPNFSGGVFVATGRA